MQWLNVSVETLQRPDFTAAVPSEIGIWLRLACYCAHQENGGTIRDCRRWSDRQWLIAAGVTKGDVETPTKLWRHDKVGGVIVAFYPIEKEREVAAKRKAGKATARARWGKRFQPKNGSSPHSSATSCPDAEGEMEEEGNRK